MPLFYLCTVLLIKSSRYFITKNKYLKHTHIEISTERNISVFDDICFRSHLN